MKAKISTFLNENILDFILFNFLIVLPSIRFFDKILSIPFFVIYFVVTNSIYIIRNKILDLKFLQYRWWILFIFISTVLNCIIYPKVDSRKIIGSGSTGDDAIIIASQTLKTTGKLYDVHIDKITPISPGPGWVILNSGFILLDLYVLFTPFYLIVLFLILRKYLFNDKQLNLFALLLGISLVFWELFFNGHDILPFSLSLLSISIIIFQISYYKTSVWRFLILGFLLGILSTCRIVFIFLPFLFSFLIMNFNRINGVILLIISVLVNLCFNLYFYSINEQFQPLHLINKGLLILGPEIFILLLITGSLGIFFLTKLKNNELILFNRKVFIVLGIFFVPIAYIDLMRVDFQFSNWEGANYLMPIIGFYILQTTSNSRLKI